MNIVTDSYYRIGSTHRVCQDFALAGARHAVISDGCSFGGATVKPPTELGAQILARRASQLLKSSPSIDHDTLIRECLELVSVLGLDSDCLAATLGYIDIDDDDFFTNLVGDGCIIARNYLGNLWVYNIEFKSGAPFYLRYLLDQNPTVDDYLKIFGDAVIETDTLIDINENNHYDNVLEYNYLERINCYSFSFDNYDLVAITSDGINSFVDSSNNPVSRNLIIEELFKFKNYNPGFLERRCNRAFQTFAKRGWLNQDDFSIGTIYVG